MLKNCFKSSYKRFLCVTYPKHKIDIRDVRLYLYILNIWFYKLLNYSKNVLLIFIFFTISSLFIISNFFLRCQFSSKYGTFPTSWKISKFLENFRIPGKFTNSWKISKFLQKFPNSCKISKFLQNLQIPAKFPNSCKIFNFLQCTKNFWNFVKISKFRQNFQISSKFPNFVKFTKF